MKEDIYNKKPIVCPFGHNIEDDHDQFDNCDNCPEDIYQVCSDGWVCKDKNMKGQK